MNSNERARYVFRTQDKYSCVRNFRLRYTQTEDIRLVSGVGFTFGVRDLIHFSLGKTGVTTAIGDYVPRDC